LITRSTAAPTPVAMAARRISGVADKINNELSSVVKVTDALASST